MILKRVPLPRLLKKELSSDGRTLREQARLHCDPDITLSMQPLSTVRITVPERDPEPAMHDFVEVYNIHGSVGIFRVVDIQPEYYKGRTMTLNHALDVLHDSLYPAEEKFTGTVRAYLTALLACQKPKVGSSVCWQLGTVEDNGTWTQELSYDNILDLVKEIPETHQDYMYTYDFSTFPWTLNLVRRPDTTLTEFRVGRNMESCKVTTNDQDMCNRLYLSVTSHTGSGKTEKTNTVIEVHDDLQAQGMGFGIIEGSAGIDTQQVTEKAAWIAGYFERHNAPYVQISVDGRDLKEQTGVSIDEMHLGYLCRTVLPRYNTIFNERIVSVRYPSALRTPDRVNVSMANKKETAEDSIASAKKEASKASKSAGGTKKKADNNSATIEENTVKYNRMLEETDKRVSSTMTATGVLLDENNEPLVGPDGLYVFDTTGPGAALSSRVTQMAGSLESEITARTAQGNTFSSRIQQLSNKISLVVTGEGDNAQVSSAAIILAVNGGTGSSAIISADKVNLEGYVTSTTLDTRLLYFDQMIGNTGTAKTIRLTGQTGMVASGALLAGSVSSTGAVSAGSFRLTSSGGNDTVLALKAVSFGGVTQGNISLMGSGSDNTLAVPDAISALQIIPAGTNAYTLQKKTFSSDSWTDVGTFNRAAQVQISGRWSGRRYIVSATPSQLNTPVGIVYDGLVPTGSISKNGKSVSRDYIVYSDDGEGDADSIIMQKTVSINASDVYDDGYFNGRPTSGTAGGRTSGVTALVHDFTINRAEGDAVVLAIDCTSIYSTARTGYTYGTFTATSVTKQGTAVSITGLGTPIRVVEQGTTTKVTKQGSAVSITGLGLPIAIARSGTSVKVTKQGSAVSVTKQGSATSVHVRGSATSVTTQGSAVSVTPIVGSSAIRLSFYNTTQLYRLVGDTYSPVGNASRSWYYVNTSSGTTRYTAGTAKTYYNAGSAATYYLSGSTKTYYEAGSAATYYEAGSEATYYNEGDTVTYYAAGSTATYYNEGTEATYYNAGSAKTYYSQGSTNTYYETGSEATYYVKGEA